jgi:Protein of unknown function (DUF3987)
MRPLDDLLSLWFFALDNRNRAAARYLPEPTRVRLPDALAGWIDDIAERLQCPPDYVAVTAMVALGTLIGRRVGIRPKQKDDWTEYAHLWGLFTGPPGSMKWPAMRAALAPFTAWRSKQLTQAKRRLRRSRLNSRPLRPASKCRRHC